MRLAAFAAAAALLVSGCGTVTEAAGGRGFEPGDVTPVVLQLEDGPVELAPWTYCLDNGRADGAAGPAPPRRQPGRGAVHVRP